VLRAKSLCVPASRDGAALREAKRNLTCHSVHDAAAGALPADTITLTTALGTDTLTTAKPRLLCVPTTVAPCAPGDRDHGAGVAVLRRGGVLPARDAAPRRRPL
jgi:hypothetical protein